MTEPAFNNSEFERNAPLGAKVADDTAHSQQIQPEQRYAPPKARVADTPAKMRIGRLGYWRSTMILGMVFLLLEIIMMGMFMEMFIDDIHGGGQVILISRRFYIGSTILFFAILFRLTVRRSHDMNWSGWTGLLVLVPLVSLIWLFKPGTQGENRFGLPSPAPSWGMGTVILIILGGWLAIYPGFLGFIAEFAYKSNVDTITRYQDYRQRARSQPAAPIQQNGAQNFRQQN